MMTAGTAWLSPAHAGCLQGAKRLRGIHWDHSGAKLTTDALVFEEFPIIYCKLL